MSLKTTHNITREAALQVIISKLYSLDDDRLADTLEIVLNDDYKNFTITDISDIIANKDDDRYIQDARYLL